MELSKKINSLLLAIMFVSCDNPERNCQDYRIGNFFTETTVNDKTYKSTFLRMRNGIQIEETPELLKLYIWDPAIPIVAEEILTPAISFASSTEF